MDARRKLAISQVTTPDWSFEEDVARYVAAGVDGIGVWRGKLRAHGVAQGAALLRSTGLAASSFNPELLLVAEPAADEATHRDELRRAMDDAVAVCAPVMIVVPGRRSSRPKEEMDELARGALGWAATEAASRGLRLAVEPIRTPYFDYLTTFREALDLLYDVGEPALGVLFDVWHLWDEPGLPALIRRAGARIGLVHLSDWREPTRWHDDRVLPGDGCIPLPLLVQAIEAAGFEGFWEVELFSTDLRAGDVRHLPAELRARFDGLMRATDSGPGPT